MPTLAGAYMCVSRLNSCVHVCVFLFPWASQHDYIAFALPHIMTSLVGTVHFPVVHWPMVYIYALAVILKLYTNGGCHTTTVAMTLLDVTFFDLQIQRRNHSDTQELVTV